MIFDTRKVIKRIREEIFDNLDDEGKIDIGEIDEIIKYHLNCLDQIEKVEESKEKMMEKDNTNDRVSLDEEREMVNKIFDLLEYNINALGFSKEDIKRFEDELLDYALPQLKSAFCDTILKCVWGEDSSEIFSSNYCLRRKPERRSYKSIWDRYSKNKTNHIKIHRLKDTGFKNELDRFIFDSEDYAYDVLNELRGYLEKYGKVSYRYLLGCVNEIPTLKDEERGWTDLTQSRIQSIYNYRTCEYVWELVLPEIINFERIDTNVRTENQSSEEQEV